MGKLLDELLFWSPVTLLLYVTGNDLKNDKVAIILSSHMGNHQISEEPSRKEAADKGNDKVYKIMNDDIVDGKGLHWFKRKLDKCME